MDFIKKSFLAHLLIFYAFSITPLWGMYIKRGPVASRIAEIKQKERQIYEMANSNVLEKSRLMQRLAEDLGLPINEIEIPNVSKDVTSFLEAKYAILPGNLNLESDSIETLIDAINAEQYLEVSPGITPQLKRAIANRIMQEPLSSIMIDSLEKLNSDVAKEVMSDLIKKTNIDTELLKGYQSKLSIKKIDYLSSSNGGGYEGSIPFFNENKIIFMDANQGETVIIDRGYPNEKIVIDAFKAEDFQSSPNSPFCIVTCNSFLPSVDHKLIDLNKSEVMDIQLTDKNEGAWCFFAEDTVLMASSKGRFAFLYLPSNQVIPLNNVIPSGEMNLRDDETIKQIACKVKEDDILYLVAFTSQNRIFVYNKKVQRSIFIDVREKDIERVKKIIMNNVEDTAYLFAKTLDDNDILLSIDLNRGVITTILPIVDHYAVTVTDDGKLSILDSAHRYHITRSYDFVSLKHFGQWSKFPKEDDNIEAVSVNGREGIEKSSLDGSYHIATLYDDNMAEALDYFDVDKTDELYTIQKKLIGSILIYTLLNRQTADQNISFDFSVIDAYQDLPTAIQFMLKKIKE